MMTEKSQILMIIDHWQKEYELEYLCLEWTNLQSYFPEGYGMSKFLADWPAPGITLEEFNQALTTPHMQNIMLLDQLRQNFYFPRPGKETGANGDSGKPEKPLQGNRAGVWLQYYDAMNAKGIKYTLKDLATDSNYSIGYLKGLHASLHPRNPEKT